MKMSGKGIKDRIISSILSIIMLVCFVVPGLDMTVYAQNEETEVTGLCETKVEVTNMWEGGYQAQVFITNNSDKEIANWNLQFITTDTITDMWDASFTIMDNSIIQANHAEWNAIIYPGEQVSFGYTATYETQACYLTDIVVKGVIAEEEEQQEIVMIQAGDVHIFEENNYSVKYVIENSWEGNYTARIELTNKTDSPIENWMISFLCEDELSGIYDASIVKHEENMYQIKNVEYNQDIPAYGTVSFGFQVTYDNIADIPHPYIVLSEETLVVSENYQLDFYVTNTWDGGYTGEIAITNIGATTIEDWHLVMESEDDIINIWNASLSEESEEYDVICAPEHEQNIHAGESRIIGFQANGNTQELSFHGLYRLGGSGEGGDNTGDDSGTDDDNVDDGNTGDDSNVDDGNTGDGDNTDDDVNTGDDSDLDADMDETVTEYKVNVYTEQFRAADMEDTYYVETEVSSLSGELIGYENVKEMNYKLADNNGYELLSGTVFDYDNGVVPESAWTIEPFGLVLGYNKLTFELILKDGTSIEQSISFLDLTGKSMGRVQVDQGDSDDDGLNNYFESVLQTDTNLADTDGDNLTDFDEFVLFGTDPLLADMDGNGITDDLEDYDEDGLNTVEEKNYNTYAMLPDSDYDGVNDGIEVNQLFSDPTKEDTDGDGLLDGQEYAMGLNPNAVDTDGDAVPDNEEIVLQSTGIAYSDASGAVSNVDITLECSGYIGSRVYIEDLTGRDCLSANVVGLVGAPINIHTDVVFDEAEIVFHYDPAKLGNIVEENLGVLWYDKENSQFVVMDDVTVDTNNHTVTCITTHFSEYMLVDKETWYSVWLNAVEYIPTYAPCDVAIMSDSTAGVYNYDTKGFGFVNFPHGYPEGENIIYGYFNVNGGHTRISWVTEEAQVGDANWNVHWYHFYSTGSTEKNGRNGKYGDGFEELVEMFSNEAYRNLNSDNPKIALFTYDGYLLETEEQNQKVEECVEQLKSMGVTVYAVSETTQINSVIESAAIATGGEHYTALSREEAQDIWLKIHEKTAGLDKDTDGDGLSDNYEIYGMRVPNGQVIKTDPETKFSDEDDRTDGEEMGELINIVVEVDGEGTTKTFKVFKWLSDPNVSDDLSGGFIYVDGMDYMPYSDALNNQIYSDQVVFEDEETKEVFCPTDRDGQYIFGCANVHDSMDFSLFGETPVSEYDDIETLYGEYNEWLLRIHLFKYNPMVVGRGYSVLNAPVDLLEHFISNEGTEYRYDGMDIEGDNIRKCLLDTMYQLKPECFALLEEGEQRYIATSPSFDMPAISLDDGWDIATNYNAFFTANSCKAAYVADCKFDGTTYRIDFKYYILDYYDWDPYKQEALYYLNAYGLSNSFYSVGELKGYATFTTDPESEIEIYLEE